MRSTFGRLPCALSVAALFSVAGAAERTVNVTKPFSSDGTVSIENVAGSVRVRGGEKPEIKVTGRLGEGVEDLEFTVIGGRATIVVKLKKGFKGRSGNADLEISVPRGVALEAETVSARIDVAELQRSVDLESVSGDIGIAGNVETVSVETVSGDISVTGVTSKVDAESVSGAIRLQGVAGTIDTKTVSGAIDVSGSEVVGASCESVSGTISFAGPLSRQGRYSFDSFSGSVELSLPEDTDANVTVSTFSGRVVNQLSSATVSGKEASFTLGDGGARVEVTTFSGNARITPLAR